MALAAAALLEHPALSTFRGITENKLALPTVS